MDLFSYTVKSAAISQLKLIRDIEEELRALEKTVTRYSYGAELNGKDAIIRPFMLFTQCFKLFESKSNRTLPDFLYITRRKAATNVIRYLVKYEDTPITYQEYLDIFQYLNTELSLPSSTVSYKLGTLSGMEVLVYLAKVVKDQPNPYKLTYTNVKVRAGELYSALMHTSNSDRNLLQALALRQNLLNDLNYTVLEDFIETFKAKTITKVNPTATLEAEQLLNASKEFDLLVPDNAN